MDGDELDAYLVKYIARVRQNVLLEAAKAICENCCKGEKIELVKYGWPDRSWGGFYHKSKGGTNNLYCIASAIHHLIAAEQGQGGERS